MHLQSGNDNCGGSAATTSKARKSAHSARQVQVSFEERSYMLTSFVMESFGCLGNTGSEFQLVASVIGAKDNDNLRRKRE